MSDAEIKILATKIGVLLAVLVPILRAGLRKRNCVSPAFTKINILSDLTNGFTLPQFFLLIIAPFRDDSALLVDSQIMVVAGFYAIVMIVNDLVDHRNPSSRTRSTDKPEVNGE